MKKRVRQVGKLARRTGEVRAHFLLAPSALICVSLLSHEALAQNVVTHEYSTSVEFDAVPIEDGPVDDLILRSSIFERDLPEFVSPVTAVADSLQLEAVDFENAEVSGEDFEVEPVSGTTLDSEGNAVVAVFTEDVPVEILQKSKKTFHALFGDTVVFSQYADPRFVGSIASNEEAAAVFSEEGSRRPYTVSRVISDSESLQGDKVYTVENGNIVEVNSYDESLLRPEKASGQGWTVIAADSHPAEATSAQVTVRESVSDSKERQSEETPVQQIASSMADKLFSLLPGRAAEGDGGQEALKVGLKGRVRVPKGVNAKSVVVRVAGTGWQLIPDAAGYFELQDIPKGSKLNLLVWDTDGNLNRRIVPVAANKDVNEIEIEMIGAAEADLVATAFGTRQSSVSAGFCGQLIASNPLSLIGAKVAVHAKEGYRGPFFYNENHFPDASLTSATKDGRLCVFNVNARDAQLTVYLLNGSRRTFQVSLHGSTFESNLKFNVDEAAYRPLQAYELVDLSESVGATERAEELRLGLGVGKGWVTGQQSPSWAKVSEFYLIADRAYAPKFVMSDTKSNLEYFPLSQSLVEISWAASAIGPRGFQLVAREDLLKGFEATEIGNNGIHVKSSDPLPLKVVDPEIVSEFDAIASSEGIDRELGVSFVNINLSAIEAEYDNVKLNLRNVWTGESVGKFHFIPLPEGVRSPRYVRGFFANLPEGDYTLIVSSKDGALKWLDIVRSRANHVQVISVRD